MTDEELIKNLRSKPFLKGSIEEFIANRIEQLVATNEALVKEREADHANINLKADFIEQLIGQSAEDHYKLAKAVEAIKLARVHVANNAQGWSVGRAAARSDLEIINATLAELEESE